MVSEQYRALADTTSELLWLRWLLKDLGVSTSSATPLYCDNHCYEYRFDGRFGLSIGTEYFGTSLFRHTVLDRFGITTLYIYIYISN